MPKQYWLFDKETLIINQTALVAQRRSGQDLYPRTALLKKPLEEKDSVQVCAVLDENGFAIDSEYVEDHRGKTIYNTQDCMQSKTVDKLGVVEDSWTLLKPATRFDEWINNVWLTNEQAQYEAQVLQIEVVRKSLYTHVDSLNSEAAMIRRTENDEEKAADYESYADGLYLKIKQDNPWPIPLISE